MRTFKLVGGPYCGREIARTRKAMIVLKDYCNADGAAVYSRDAKGKFHFDEKLTRRLTRAMMWQPVNWVSSKSIHFVDATPKAIAGFEDFLS